MRIWWYSFFCSQWNICVLISKKRALCASENSISLMTIINEKWNIPWICFAFVLINYMPQPLAPFANRYFEMLSQRGRETNAQKNSRWVSICMWPIIIVKRFDGSCRRITLMSSVCRFHRNPSAFKWNEFFEFIGIIDCRCVSIWKTHAQNAILLKPYQIHRRHVSALVKTTVLQSENEPRCSVDKRFLRKYFSDWLIQIGRLWKICFESIETVLYECFEWKNRKEITINYHDTFVSGNSIFT